MSGLADESLLAAVSDWTGSPRSVVDLHAPSPLFYDNVSFLDRVQVPDVCRRNLLRFPGRRRPYRRSLVDKE